MRDDFATFILTHGRADSVLTYGALKNAGYTGRIYLLVDDKDKQIDRYLENYGDEVIVFNKDKAVAMTDACDNYNRHNSVVFARNYNFIVARELGIKYFWQLDDDYPSFWWSFDNDKQYVTMTNEHRIRGMDSVLEACVEFLVASDATSVAFAQGGDFIGGPMSQVAKQWFVHGWFSRKAMNSFLFDADRPVTFRGRVNDDVNLYVECGRRGELFVTIPRLRIQQPETQKNSGGCTDIYLEMGTYIKSFYSILVAPSCVKIATMGVTHRRIHHAVQWKYACPKILHSKYRKPRVA
ncbi:hypothetical protein EBZ80_24845 [bacterium]|nr:hypothetical protein [bacterium]